MNEITRRERWRDRGRERNRKQKTKKQKKTASWVGARSLQLDGRILKGSGETMVLGNLSIDPRLSQPRRTSPSPPHTMVAPLPHSSTPPRHTITQTARREGGMWREGKGMLQMPAQHTTCPGLRHARVRMHTAP